MKAILGSVAVLSALAAAPFATEAQQRGGSAVKSLVEIVSGVEKGGYGPVVEVSFDDGVWEVEAFKGDTAFELAVDPRSGDVISEHRDYGKRRPPEGSLPLSEIVARLQKSGLTQIDEISFERQSWEVEAFRDNQKRELHVDPLTADIIFDRIDD